MADFEKKVDPNATIQLDKIDAADLAQLEADALLAAAKKARAGADEPPMSAAPRTAPPPLPPEVIAAAAASQASPAAPSSAVPSSAPARAERSKGAKIAIGGVFVVLLAGAVGLGLLVGGRLRGEPAAQSAPSAAAPPASQAAPAHPITVPEVEISSP